MKSKKNIVGVILTYNCGHLVEKLYRRVPKSSFSRIIFVDDGSTDDTVQRVKRFGGEIFTHKHLGYGGNMKYGLRKALSLGAEYIVEIHGDGQYDPSVIPDGLREIQKGFGLLLGSRFVDRLQPLRDKMPLERYVANILLSLLYKMILRSTLTEFHTGFHIYSKEFLETVGFRNTSDGHLYSLQIIFQAYFRNIRVCEIPIRCDYHAEHTSISIKKSVAYSLQSVRLVAEYIASKLGYKTGIFAAF